MSLAANEMSAISLAGDTLMDQLEGADAPDLDDMIGSVTFPRTTSRITTVSDHVVSMSSRP